MEKFIVMSSFGVFVKATKINREDGTWFISNTFCSDPSKAQVFENFGEATKEADRLTAANNNAKVIPAEEAKTQLSIFGW